MSTDITWSRSIILHELRSVHSLNNARCLVISDTYFNGYKILLLLKIVFNVFLFAYYFKQLGFADWIWNDK